jgi:hypothetical protein
MPALTTAYLLENAERYIPNPDIRKWNQSYYFNFYDPKARTGGFIRIGILENLNETNGFTVFFRDGKPLFTRINMNLPATKDRPDPGMTVAGTTMQVIEPLQKCRVSVDTAEFKADLIYDLRHEMGDSIGLSKTGPDDAIANELAFIHPEGVCNVTGTITLHTGEVIEIETSGIRDISAGPRNWSALKYYRLAWPIFDNGVVCTPVHGVTDHGDAYQRILHDGTRWHTIQSMEETVTFESDDITVASAHWKVTDEDGRLYDFTGKPLFRWMFPFDTFVFTEQMMEWTLADGTLGYGMVECGFNFPWRGNGN